MLAPAQRTTLSHSMDNRAHPEALGLTCGATGLDYTGRQQFRNASA